MNKLLISAGLIALAAGATGASAQTIKLGTEGAYAPWNFER